MTRLPLTPGPQYSSPDTKADGHCSVLSPRSDGSFWVCSHDAGHDGHHSWSDKPTEFSTDMNATAAEHVGYDPLQRFTR